MRPEERQLLRNALPGALFVAAMWFIHLLAWLTGINLAFLGVYPRHASGIPGIFLAPLIHGDLLHLLSNSFPLLLLSAFLFHSYRKIALEVCIWVYLTTGFWTFLLARQAHHIGASGVVYGLASFLLFIGLFRRDRNSISLSAVILVLYGGLVYGVLPLDTKISWESHLFGALAGLLLAFFFRNFRKPEKPAPAPPQPEPHLIDPFAPWNLTPPEVWLDSETYHLAQQQKQLLEQEAHARLNPGPEPLPQHPITTRPAAYYSSDSVFPVRFRYVIKDTGSASGAPGPAHPPEG